MEQKDYHLVKIEPIERLLNLSFDQYIEKRYDGTILEHIEDAEEKADKNDLYTKYQYLIDTVTDYSTRKDEIKELWKLTEKKLDSEDFEIYSFNEGTIKFLIEMTLKAGFNNEEINVFDSNLHFAVLRHIEKSLTSSINPANIISQLIYYLSWHTQYLKVLNLGLPISDFKFIDDIFNRYSAHLEIVKNQAPTTYIKFIEVFKHRYKTDTVGYKTKFKNLYQRLCLEEIIVSKNFGYYNNYYSLLEDYYNEKYANKKKLNWAFKNLIGYGEKPWLLLFLFFGVNLFFALIFSTNLFKFHQPEANIQWSERFINFIYFNNTSMLTVGYGDIYPTDNITKLMVIVLQILGFIISGTAIALLLRRVLRF